MPQIRVSPIGLVIGLILSVVLTVLLARMGIVGFFIIGGLFLFVLPRAVALLYRIRASGPAESTRPRRAYRPRSVYDEEQRRREAYAQAVDADFSERDKLKNDDDTVTDGDTDYVIGPDGELEPVRRSRR